MIYLIEKNRFRTFKIILYVLNTFLFTELRIYVLWWLFMKVKGKLYYFTDLLFRGSFNLSTSVLNLITSWANDRYSSIP